MRISDWSSDVCSSDLLRWTNLYIHDTLKQSRLASGFASEGLGDNTRILKQDTNWVERQLIDTHLVGECKFDDLSVDIRGAYANTQRDPPYKHRFSYVFDDSDTVSVARWARVCK